MRKKIKTEIISTIKSRKNFETFFEVLTLSLGEKTILQLLEKAKSHINNKEK